MQKRLRTLGIVLLVMGVGFVAAGGFAWIQVQNGYEALETYSAAQNVTLNYNDDGQLTDRGTTEGAEAIMTLLTDEWGYAVNEADFDPADPLVNTPTEYMYQMAVISYHILHGTQTVVLAEDVEYNGQVFTAGTYEFEVDGRYWTDFDRRHPIEGPARSQAWSGTAHGLVAELGVGTTTASTLELATGVAAIVFGLGAAFVLTGLGLMWVAKEEKLEVPSSFETRESPEPASS